MERFQLDTPALVIDSKVLVENIKDMSEFARINGVKLRPHIKSHKMSYIGNLQREYGAKGITVAKLGEAETMAQKGIDDIFIAYQLIGEEKLQRFFNLTDKAKLRVAVDSMYGAMELSRRAQQRKISVDIMVEIDTGLRRCGLVPGKDAEKLIYEIHKLPFLNFKGIFTHAGNSYGCDSIGCVEAIGKHEGEVMVALAESLKSIGIMCHEISVGSTPTAKFSGAVKGVTEIRPGNYVFNDAIQVGLGIAKEYNCSLRVYARVISRPESNRAIIDAGSKVLALDKGAHGNSIVQGHGVVVSHRGATVSRLSEEHGILDLTGCDKEMSIGDLVEIIPNHACTVINLSSNVYVVKDSIIEKVEVEARGKVE